MTNIENPVRCAELRPELRPEPFKLSLDRLLAEAMLPAKHVGSDVVPARDEELRLFWPPRPDGTHWYEFRGVDSWQYLPTTGSNSPAIDLDAHAMNWRAENVGPQMTVAEARECLEAVVSLKPNQIKSPTDLQKVGGFEYYKVMQAFATLAFHRISNGRASACNLAILYTRAKDYKSSRPEDAIAREIAVCALTDRSPPISPVDLYAVEVSLFGGLRYGQVRMRLTFHEPALGNSHEPAGRQEVFDSTGYYTEYLEGRHRINSGTLTQRLKLTDPDDQLCALRGYWEGCRLLAANLARGRIVTPYEISPPEGPQGSIRILLTAPIKVLRIMRRVARIGLRSSRNLLLAGTEPPENKS